MSSKLYRGGDVPSEPMLWRRVPSFESIPAGADAFPAAAHAPQPASPTSASHPASTVEQHLQGAYQQGFKEGQEAARKQSATQLDAMGARLARTIEELSGLRQRFRHEAEEEVVALSLAIARRILHRELTVSPDALLGLLKAALEKIEVREIHHVRLRPEDVSLVQQHLDRIGLPQRVELVADPRLERGAAVLESSRGALDISVETQLAEIERGFADLVRRS